MKSQVPWAFFFLCLVLFVIFRLWTPHNQLARLTQDKPVLLAPCVLKFTTRSDLPKVYDAAIEIARDLGKIEELAHLIPGSSVEELTQILMNKLQLVQKQIPFDFPKELYNVLWIPESNFEQPISFHILKRLYLGETELGMPFYLDVRLFDMQQTTPSALIAWHLEILKGTCEQVFQSELRNIFICKGVLNPERTDPTHGFATLQGQRTLYLDFFEQGSRLYVGYAESSSKTFQAYKPLFSALLPDAFGW